jgi:hypothetical protein
MKPVLSILSAVVSTGLFFGPAPMAAQTADPLETIIELGAQSTLLSYFDTLYRLTEELVFWQSVSIMGAEYGWDSSYYPESGEIEPYTFNLDNSLEESATDAARAANAIGRSITATEEEQSAAADLYALHLQMRGHAQVIHDLLLQGRINEAADLFDAEVLPLRRQFYNEAYTSSAYIRERVGRTVLDSRLGR